MSSFGLIEKNMELSHILLAVQRKKTSYIAYNAQIYTFATLYILYHPKLLKIVHTLKQDSTFKFFASV